MLIARGAAAEQIRILPADLGDEEQRTRATEIALGPGRVDILAEDQILHRPAAI